MEKEAKSKSETPPVHNLSFVGRRPGRHKGFKPGRYAVHFWKVKPTGDYGEDCSHGRDLALEYLAFAEQDNSTHLQLIISDMPRELTGVEVAFLSMIDIAARSGAGGARAVDAYWKRCEAERLSKKAKKRSAR
ncbi:MAG: hypothetical protein JSR99_08340 [Proteobacteria bacterium]|nr:hypothetical protein [Pseudomonadota bacterium]